MYDSSTSERRKLKELDFLRSTVSGIDKSYSGVEIKKLLQEKVFQESEKFGTWSPSSERVD